MITMLGLFMFISHCSHVYIIFFACLYHIFYMFISHITFCMFISLFSCLCHIFSMFISHFFHVYITFCMFMSHCLHVYIIFFACLYHISLFCIFISLFSCLCHIFCMFISHFLHVYSLQPGHYSSLPAANFQPTATQERDGKCGNQHYSSELLMMGIAVPEIC